MSLTTWTQLGVIDFAKQAVWHLNNRGLFVSLFGFPCHVGSQWHLGFSYRTTKLTALSQKHIFTHIHTHTHKAPNRINGYDNHVPGHLLPHQTDHFITILDCTHMPTRV